MHFTVIALSSMKQTEDTLLEATYIKTEIRVFYKYKICEKFVNIQIIVK